MFSFAGEMGESPAALSSFFFLLFEFSLTLACIQA